jgi:hypothetical protein
MKSDINRWLEGRRKVTLPLWRFQRWLQGKGQDGLSAPLIFLVFARSNVGKSTMKEKPRHFSFKASEKIVKIEAARF